ncbi:MAG: enoyl-CoA hydratase/isomerase family protein [Proteobacteria bacterium]|nr:enoyl-CoA hydratase/isomerase family protein [Pseudomonadota bacterium]MBU1697776.1 enoyl-CoA hydratase/isomerase family protein [Pseudomonadota bacterium]
MSQKDLLYKKENNRAYITINREKQRNSISVEAVNLFLEYLDEAQKDDEVWVVCVTAAGEKIFCSGADLAGSIGKAGEPAGKAFQNYAKLLTKISKFPKPTVARINGHCMAGGTGFMLACDIVIARDDIKFGTPEVNVGLFPMMIGALIFRNVLRKKAMEMILLGEKLSAAQAFEMGLVTRIYPLESFEEEVEKVLTSLTLKSPIGMKIGKQAFNAIDTMPLEEAVNFLSERLAEVASTDDAVEGITAFIEKRQPVFTGK